MFLNVSALHRSLSRSFSVSFPDIVQYFIELLSLQMHFNHLSCSILMYWPFNVYDSECESWSLIWSDEKKKEWNLTSMRFSLESNFGSFWLIFFWSHFIVIISLKLFSYVSSFRCHTFLSSDLPNSENRIWFDGKWPNTHAFIHSLTHSQSHTHSHVSGAMMTNLVVV